MLSVDMTCQDTNDKQISLLIVLFGEFNHQWAPVGAAD